MQYLRNKEQLNADDLNCLVQIEVNDNLGHSIRNKKLKKENYQNLGTGFGDIRLKKQER
jgi:hypothetical protein